MSALDDWTTAIVRGRDGRKGKVLQGRTRYVVVHWEDDTTTNVHRTLLTVLRPPLGYQRVTVPERETFRERLERTGIWWAGLAALGAILAAVTLFLYYGSQGWP